TTWSRQGGIPAAKKSKVVQCPSVEQSFCLQKQLHIRRQRTGHSDVVVCDRLDKMQHGTMQCMSADGFGTASIERIPCQRMADIRHMYPNLMGTPGSGRAGKQTVLPSGCKNRVLCQTIFALRRHTTADNGIA